jgi:hypothetical protein
MNEEEQIAPDMHVARQKNFACSGGKTIIFNQNILKQKCFSFDK